MGPLHLFYFSVIQFIAASSNKVVMLFDLVTIE